MLYRVNRLALSLALAGCANLSHAAGFALIEQNASGLGNAYAGQAAAATDASTIFFNPAGMTYLPERQVVMAGHLIRPEVRFSGTVTPDGGNGGDAGGLALVPNAYFAYRLAPDVHFGVGLNAPFGLKTEYDPAWKGRIHAIKSEVKTVNFNPSIAWRASESLSLGAGVSVQYAEATLTNATNGAGRATVKGDDIGWGYNLGALWQLGKATRVGLAYRSEVEQDLGGDVGFSTAAALNGPVNAELTLPDSAALSLFHRFDSRWELLADITWTGWSDFRELRIVRTNGQVLGTPTEENWDDTYRYSLGANYHFSKRLTLRSGVAFDQTPVSDAFRTARIPDEDRTWIALGAQYRLSATSAIDVGYAHLFVKDAAIDKTENGLTLAGRYDASVDIFSAQFTRSF